eukprot:1178546-Prorocentrum_minimum.AAC.2
MYSPCQQTATRLSDSRLRGLEARPRSLACVSPCLRLLGNVLFTMWGVDHQHSLGRSRCLSALAEGVWPVGWGRAVGGVPAVPPISPSAVQMLAGRLAPCQILLSCLGRGFRGSLSLPRLHQSQVLCSQHSSRELDVSLRPRHCVDHHVVAQPTDGWDRTPSTSHQPQPHPLLGAAVAFAQSRGSGPSPLSYLISATS